MGQSKDPVSVNIYKRPTPKNIFLPLLWLYVKQPSSLSGKLRPSSGEKLLPPPEFTIFFFLNFFWVLFLFIIYLFIYLWLCWVLISVRGLSLVVASGGHSSSRRAGLSLSRPLLLQSTGSRRAGSVIVAHGPSCSAACGILPDQGSNPCLLHWQADSQPLRHQGSPTILLTFKLFSDQHHICWKRHQ